MVFLSKSKTNRVEFRVVYAFPTAKHVQEEYGIYYNFSAKVFMHVGGVEVPLMSLNQMSIVVSKDGRDYVSSMSNRPTLTNKNTGQRYLGKRVDATTMFPGHRDSEEGRENYQAFMTDLLNEIDEFIKEKRAEQKPRKVPERLANLETLDSNESSQPRQHEDIPF